MFTGIIEATGTLTQVIRTGGNKTFRVRSSLAADLKVDQSLCHDGVCLTVEAVDEDHHQVTAIAETLVKTNLDQWKEGSRINLERCMLMNGRIDGHIVQGHVDCTAACEEITENNGSWEYRFTVHPRFGPLMIEKGSLTVNGISLTIFNVTPNSFTMAIIPYTFEHTNINQLRKGDLVNIEFDVIGKYIIRGMSLK